MRGGLYCRGFVPALVAGLLVAGCGGDDNTTADAASGEGSADARPTDGTTFDVAQGHDGGADAPADTTAPDVAPIDTGADAPFDTNGGDASDSGDAGLDAGFDAGFDAGLDAGFDAGFDAGIDAGPGPLVFRGAFVGGGAAPAVNQNVKLNGVFVWQGAVNGQSGGVRLSGWLH